MWSICHSPQFSKTHKKRTKEYALNNRKKINEYFKLRYVNKPHEYAWRGMLGSMTRRFGGKKESTTYETLGYSAEQLKEHSTTFITYHGRLFSQINLRF